MLLLLNVGFKKVGYFCGFFLRVVWCGADIVRTGL